MLITFTLSMVLTAFASVGVLRVGRSLKKVRTVSLNSFYISTNNIKAALDTSSKVSINIITKEAGQLVASMSVVSKSIDKKLTKIKKSLYKDRGNFNFRKYRTKRLAMDRKLNSRVRDFKVTQTVNYKLSSVSKKNGPRENKVSKFLNNYEINNNELVKHYGFDVSSDVDSFAFSSIKIKFPIKLKIAKTEVLDIQKRHTELELLDQVRVQNSSLKKSSFILDIKKDIAEFKNDESRNLIEDMKENLTVHKAKTKKIDLEKLVIYDYSKKEDVGSSDKGNISLNVLDSMKRIMATQGKPVKTRTKPTKEVSVKIAEYSKRVGDDGSRNSAVIPALPSRNDLLNSLYGASSPDYSPGDKVSKLIIKSLPMNIDLPVEKNIIGFEIAPHFDSNERYYDNAEGEVIIEKKLQGDLSIFNGTIIHPGSITTNISLPMEEGIYDYEIPLLGQGEFASFLEKEEINVDGGFLLIELSDDIESMDIESKFAARVFLNSNFKVVSQDSEIKYVLYIGVKQGNTLVSYISFDDQVAQKIIYIKDNEIHFEKAMIVNSKFESFEVKEARVLGKVNYELNIDGEKISYFNRNIRAQNVGINSYKIQNPALAMGMRKYYEFNHLEHSIFLGKWEQKSVEIPGREYIDYIFETFELESLNKRCMIQVNLKSEAIDFLINGDAFNGPMHLDTKYLDKDGLFNDEMTPFAKSVFIVGEHEGVVNFQVRYQNGSSDTLQSICSDNSYLVEQL